jgi:hypothetical protein
MFTTRSMCFAIRKESRMSQTELVVTPESGDGFTNQLSINKGLSRDDFIVLLSIVIMVDIDFQLTMPCE